MNLPTNDDARDEYSPSATVRLIGMDPDLPPGRLSFDRILFLDIDGVLHADDADRDQLLCFMPAFCEVIREVDPRGEMPIVISSMWRFTSTVAQLRALFPDDLARQVVGVTSDLLDRSGDAGGWVTSGSTRTGSRQREVLHWMRKYAPAGQWLAVDDRPSYFSLDCPNLFVVPGQYADEGGGITAAVAVSLRQRLQEFLDCNRGQALREQAPSQP